MPFCSLLLHLSMHSSLPTEVSVQRTEYTVSLLPEGFFTERLAGTHRKAVGGHGRCPQTGASNKFGEVWAEGAASQNRRAAQRQGLVCPGLRGSGQVGLALGINQRSGDEQLLPHKPRPQSSWPGALVPRPGFSSPEEPSKLLLEWGGAPQGIPPSAWRT